MSLSENNLKACQTMFGRLILLTYRHKIGKIYSSAQAEKLSRNECTHGTQQWYFDAYELFAVQVRYWYYGQVCL